MAVVNWLDPCAKATALRNAYYAFISGGIETVIRYRGPEGEREVHFAKTNLELLKSELQAAEAECAATTGATSPRRRYVIRGGSRRF